MTHRINLALHPTKRSSYLSSNEVLKLRKGLQTDFVVLLRCE